MSPGSGRRAASIRGSVRRFPASPPQRGVLHRDLKPANSLIDCGDQPRITDFGLAERRQFDSALTVTGPIPGTPPSMPPEQAGRKRGEISTARDVSSLGAIPESFFGTWRFGFWSFF